MTFSLEQMPQVTLNNGQTIPQLGLGVYKVTQKIAEVLVLEAIERGYRRIDTASLYDNEPEVGSAIRRSGLPREELFLTTKIWHDHHGYDDTLEAIDEALDRLKIQYVDMLLIHWPVPRLGKYLETWQAFEEAQKSGRIRGIGVSNFEPVHLQTLIDGSHTVPAINQVELNPGFQQPVVREFNSMHGIATEAWSPLARGRMNEHPTILGLVAKHGKSAAQVVLRWHLQLGNLVIPKTSNPDRLSENIDVFDFELDDSDMAAMLAMDTGIRTGLDPNEF